MGMSEGLTKEQEKLLAEIPQELRRETALEYIASGYINQTAAYLSACEKMGRKPSKNPETSASEILGYPNVIRFINSVKEVNAERAQMNAEYVLNRLREIDELDIIDILEEDLSSFKKLSEWPKAWRTSISGIDIKRMFTEDIDTVIDKIKWPDKLKNLELIGKHVSIKAWDKDVEVNSQVHNIMPVPQAASAEEWEEAAKAQQSEMLSKHD